MSSKKHQMIILDRTGHSTVEWSVDDEIETEFAAKKFADLAGHGYLGTKVNGPGEYEAIDKFDKEATEILMMPQFQGG